MASFVLLLEGEPHTVEVNTTSSGVFLEPTDVKAVLGWELKPEGLCRGDICIPISRGIAPDGRLDLGVIAELVDRPLALAAEHSVAYLGPPYGRYEETLGLLEAPDFTLPDLNGDLHSLTDHRGSKVLLAAWASW